MLVLTTENPLRAVLAASSCTDTTLAATEVVVEVCVDGAIGLTTSPADVVFGAVVRVSA